MTQNEMIKKVNEYLKSEEFGYAVYADGTGFSMDIEDGDWKHEHLRATFLISGFFGALGIMMFENCETYGDWDGDDCYSAIHHWEVVKGMEYPKA